MHDAASESELDNSLGKKIISLWHTDENRMPLKHTHCSAALLQIHLLSVAGSIFTATAIVHAASITVIHLSSQLYVKQCLQMEHTH